MSGAKQRIIDVNCDKGLEVSFVPRGSNPLSKVVLKKSADHQPLEIPNMALKSVVLAHLMSTAAGVAFAKSFQDEAAIDAYVAKSDAEQTAELTAFAKAKGMPFGEPDADDEKAKAEKAKAEKEAADKAAAEKAAAEKAAVEKGDVAALVKAAVEKALEPVTAQLKKAEDTVAKLQGGVVKATLEKRAETEFKGIGKSLDERVSILKAVDTITDQAAKEAIENILKAHAELVALTAKARGAEALEKTEGTATARLNKMVEDFAVKNKVSKAEAEVAVQTDPANVELMEAVDAEFAAL